MGKSASTSEVMITAIARFQSLPFDEVQMNDVAARAGVSRALLYRHFPTKRDLLAGVYQRAANELLAVTRTSPHRWDERPMVTLRHRAFPHPNG